MTQYTADDKDFFSTLYKKQCNVTWVGNYTEIWFQVKLNRQI